MRIMLCTAWILLAVAAAGVSQEIPASDNRIMLTVILRHDQTKTLDEINHHLEETGFRRTFPPEGVEILSYHIVMGVGHIITLRLPPEKLREVNVAFEKGVWGAFHTEYYPSYDYLAVFNELKRKDGEKANQPGASNETKDQDGDGSPTPRRNRTHRNP
ncbi:MAG TPA: hypothetical protein VGD78_12400 [Chthoniobacterales bacterium]